MPWHLKVAFPPFGQNFVFDANEFQSRKIADPENLSLQSQLVFKKLQILKWKITQYLAFLIKNGSIFHLIFAISQ